MWLNRTHHPTSRNFIEQPRDPNEWCLELGEEEGLYPSFLRWEETSKVSLALGLKESRIEQGGLGHQTTKPSTLLSDLEEIQDIDGLKAKNQSQVKTKWPTDLEERLQFSRSLAAWAPGLKKLLSEVICRLASHLEPSVKKLSLEELEEVRKWEAHVRQGHTPYRRDCAVCVEACGRDKPHRRRPTGEAFTMSLDIAGPYDVGVDQAVLKPRYYVTSVMTIPKVDDNPLVQGLREMGMRLEEERTDHNIAPGSVEDASRDGVGGQSTKSQSQPAMEVEKPVISAVQQRGGHQPGELMNQLGAQEERDQQPGEQIALPRNEGDQQQSQDPFEVGKEKSSELTEVEVQEMDRLNAEWAQLIKDRPEVEVVHLAQSIPIASRKPKDVLAAVSLMYCRLRSLRIPILRVHSDRAKEFIGKDFKMWCAARDLWRTTTSGSEPQSNARAEMEIGAVRNVARTMLKASGASNNYWPLAIRCASEMRFRQQLSDLGVPTAKVIPFGIRALARKKPWHRTSAWDPPNIPVRLWGPACDLSLTSGGYYAEMEDGKCIRTTAVIVPKWKSQACQALHSEPQQLMNPEAHIGDSPGFVNPNEVLGLEEPGAGFDGGNHGLDGLQEESHEDEPLLEIVQDLEISMEEPSRSTSYPPKRRLHQKTTPILPGVQTTPTLRRLTRCVGGESDLKEIAEELEKMDKLTMFQHSNLDQVVQELVADVSEGIQSNAEATLREVKREAREIEGHLKAINGVEEVAVKEEVLQTRTVSVQEVRKEMEQWKEPFQDEYATLCSTVIKPLDPTALKEVLKSAVHVERIPSKIVPTIKPPFKRRGRIVACGNYAAAPEGDVSAGGVETICLRTLLRKTANNQWSAATIDVKKAFLNAPRTEKKGHITLIDPPAVLVAMGVVPKNESWLCTGAIYGLTQSPHDWGMHRDQMFRQLQWNCQQEGLKLVETPERHLWRIINKDTQEEKGYLCSYVDDLMVVGEMPVVSSTIKKIESTWACSDPEYVNQEKNTRFCGYELRWDHQGNLLLMQPSYIMDILQKYQVSSCESDPCPKIQHDENEQYSAETLRAAQQITGEILWIQTRTRPDLSYVVGAMSRWLHKRPGYVVQLGQHVLKYLAGTTHYGLCYGVCDPMDWNPEDGLQTAPSMDQVDVFVDSSFSLEHEQYRSVTGVVLQQGGAPISWTSGRQPFIASSTTEAEILGYSESLQQAESLDMLLKVFNVDSRFNLYGDSKSALALSTGEGGPWRTRHLRLRSAKLRETLRTSREGRDGCDQPKWTARHLPGVKLVADGLTKALCGRAFVNFRTRLHMVDTRMDHTKVEPKINRVVASEETSIKKSWWSRLAAVGALLIGLSKSWMVALGTLILTMVKLKGKEEKDQESHPKVRAFRAPGDHTRDQLPLRPPTDQANRRAREQAQNLGTGHREIYRNFDIPQPHFRRERQWWEDERFDKIPVGPDKWITTREGLVIRTHNKQRRRSFHPLHRSVPVEVSTLKAVRYTVVFPDDQQSIFVDPRPRLVETDEWSGSAQWSKDYRWRGYTIFVQKSCTIGDEGPPEGNYVDEVLPAPRRRTRQVFGGEQIHRDDNLPPEEEHHGAEAGQSAASSSSGYAGPRSLGEAALINVTVNVHTGSRDVVDNRPMSPPASEVSEEDSEFEFVTP